MPDLGVFVISRHFDPSVEICAYFTQPSLPKNKKRVLISPSSRMPPSYPDWTTTRMRMRTRTRKTTNMEGMISWLTRVERKKRTKPPCPVGCCRNDDLEYSDEDDEKDSDNNELKGRKPTTKNSRV